MFVRETFGRAFIAVRCCDDQIMLRWWRADVSVSVSGDVGGCVCEMARARNRYS